MWWWFCYNISVSVLLFYSNDKLSFQFVLSGSFQTNSRLNTRDYNQNFSKIDRAKKNSNDPHLFSASCIVPNPLKFHQKNSKIRKLHCFSYFNIFTSIPPKKQKSKHTLWIKKYLVLVMCLDYVSSMMRHYICLPRLPLL